MAEKSDSQPPKRKVLDLIEEKPAKPSRRARQRTEAEAVEAAPKARTVDDAKREALDLFAEEKPKAKRPARAGSVLPSISKVLDDQANKSDLDMIRGAGKSEVPATPVSAAQGPPAGGPPAAAPADDQPAPDPKLISIKPPIIVSELAERMKLKSFQIMADLIKLEVFVAPHQAIEPEIAAQICELHGFTFEREKREKGGGVHHKEEIIAEPEPEIETPEDKLVFRAPIITFMGHVDHGKTSLLDYLRKSKVTAGEAGGITQHIGAYQVEHNGQPVTFIDTPGHAIFSEMRARGADVTDIVVLVVAANDGIMPQTEEAIKLALAANKTIIVAINKCDLPTADPTRVKTQLMDKGLNPVDFGGDIECLEVSALTGMGMDDLLELMALQAEVLELRANPGANARAAVIEASIQAGKGPTATVIVETGTLKVGRPFICGASAGKVKSLIDDTGKSIQEAGPGRPVEVLGFAELPNVGDELVEMETDRAAKKLSEERQMEQRQERLVAPNRTRMENMLSFVGDAGRKAQLNLILKCDVQGSVEAIRNAISEIQSDKVKTHFIHAAAGAITESDIQLAASANAVVLGFNTKLESNAVRAVKSEDVQVKLFSIVYELIDQVRDAMLGLLDPEVRETIIGHAEVKEIFRVLRGRAAGCYVKDGKIRRKAHARVLRGRTPVFDGRMSTLRRFQDEVDEVKQGIECGIRLGDFNEYEVGDVIECYLLEKVAQTL
jgi:translation initiation factor IF-2